MTGKFSLQERERMAEAWDVIAACQLDLGRVLSDGERRDLLKDNFPWPSREADWIVAHIRSVAHMLNAH